MSKDARYSAETIRQRVREGLLEAVTHVEDALVTALRDALAKERQELAVLETAPTTKVDDSHNRLVASINILEMILENIAVSHATRLPLCQDTGMVVAWIAVGPQCQLGMHAIEAAVNAGIGEAVVQGYFRNSIVDDPLFDRINTNTNLPAVLHWTTCPTGDLSIALMLKGFGSENCGGVAMLAPTAGEAGVVEAVVAIVRKAGGKPCPPIVLGVGLGGTMEQAAWLSKKALYRPVGEPHPQVRYADLERKILSQVQEERIGAGGFGGTVTALGVALEHYPTHIAGLPVAVSISCWADRKTMLQFGGACDV
ncbi:MAG: fumarate hydratase [Spirochaetae bacterium HGW-Spirochaetae-8]|nr:MAG: fumarate hydratase [Spirochaetae bacterium HGW-Spirochaetae-8]